MITEQTLRRLWPRGDSHVKGLIAGIASAAPSVFTRYGLTSPLAVAHAMAQFSHECMAGQEMEEDLNYSAGRLVQVWPTHFNASNAAHYAHNPRALGNFIYEPPQHRDLGNIAGTDDGYNFRGRGLAQTTGRSAYDRLGRQIGLSLILHPELINEPSRALECGVADFIACGCLPYALRDDVTGVTRKLNGGLNGLTERKMWLARWKAALGAETPADLQAQASAARQRAKTAKTATGVGGAIIAGAGAAVAAHHGLSWEVLGLAALAAFSVAAAYLIVHGKQTTPAPIQPTPATPPVAPTKPSTLPPDGHH